MNDNQFDENSVCNVVLTVNFQMIIFVAWACFCGALVDKVGVGLDQKLSMPQVGHIVYHMKCGVQ